MLKARDIKKRIRAVENMMQLTKAMKLVSATKLRRAQESILAARPYAEKMLEVLNSLATRANPESHTLLAKRDEKTIEIVVITSDKGLCASFNSNILRQAVEVLQKKDDRACALYMIGKKGRDYMRKRKYKITKELTDISRAVKYGHASAIARDLMEKFTAKEVDAIYLVYNEFKSVARQKPVVEPLLPIQRLDLQTGNVLPDYIYEPSAAELFDDVLPRHVVTQVYRALLESAAAEHAARTNAMEAATSNAQDMIYDLTLKMNRVRQNSITTELIEIVYGAEALKKGRS